MAAWSVGKKQLNKQPKSKILITNYLNPVFSKINVQEEHACYGQHEGLKGLTLRSC